MEDRLEPLLAARPWAMSPEEVVADLDALVPWLRQAEAALLARVRELDGQGIARSHGATSAAVWLRNRYLMSHAAAQRYVRLAASVDRAPVPVQDAVGNAEVNLEQAEAIIRSLDDLPPDTDVTTRDLAAKELVRLAQEWDPAHLRVLGTHILRVVAPDAADESDRRALERLEARARERRGFTMSPDPSGFGFRLSGRLTNEAAAVVRAALDPLCHPARPANPPEPTPDAPPSPASGAISPPASGPPTVPASDATSPPAFGATIPSAPGATSPLGSGVSPGPWTAAPRDDRTATQRRADALVEVCRLALNTTELPRNGGDRPQVVVSIPYDVVRRELGAGTLDNGDRVTPESARRLACDCRLLPIVLDGKGQPLDVGRTRRLVGATLRQALVARDRGCTFPGCDRGPRWTDAHHVVSWAAGGPTALGNLALLCQTHHTDIHNADIHNAGIHNTGTHGDRGWTMYMATDGFPSFIPPPHVDPQQVPRRNRYHRRQ